MRASEAALVAAQRQLADLQARVQHWRGQAVAAQQRVCAAEDDNVQLLSAIENARTGP